MNTDFIDALVRRPSMERYDREDLRQSLITFMLERRNAGVEASPEEIAREFRRLLKRIRRHVVRQLPFSLASPPASPRLELWDAAKDCLTQREYSIMRDVFFFGLSVAQVADAEGVTVSRVHQIKDIAIEKLRNKFEK